MEEVCSQELCTACTACYSICSQNAIKMVPNAFGNLYPKINKDLCIDCGACNKVCPVNNPLILSEPISSIAAYSKEPKDRQSSASGGIASVLSSYVLERGGVVYGCVQENVSNINHERIDSMQDLFKLKGSKYVHSPLGETFNNVRHDLKLGILVLFVGTPCQCAGLKVFLRKNYHNLLLVDICCHGVVSQQFLQDEILLMKNKKGINFNNNYLKVSFREKKYSIKKKKNKYQMKYGFFVDYLNTRVYSKYVPNNHYISGFLSGLFFRPNCFSCKYASRKRVSDITLADHWGMGKSDNPEMIVQKGLSTMLINTEKGESLFNSIKKTIVYEERSWEESIDGNGQFIHASKKPYNYEAFLEDYLSKGYEKACLIHLKDYKRTYKSYYLRMKLISFLKSIPYAQVVIDFIKRY